MEIKEIQERVNEIQRKENEEKKVKSIIVEFVINHDRRLRKAEVKASSMKEIKEVLKDFYKTDDIVVYFISK